MVLHLERGTGYWIAYLTALWCNTKSHFPHPSLFWHWASRGARVYGLVTISSKKTLSLLASMALVPKMPEDSRNGALARPEVDSVEVSNLCVPFIATSSCPAMGFLRRLLDWGGGGPPALSDNQCLIIYEKKLWVVLQKWCHLFSIIFMFLISPYFLEVS